MQVDQRDMLYRDGLLAERYREQAGKLPVAALACFWLSALKPLLAKKKLRMWRQETGGLSLGVGFGAAF